jgi:hypothetical protein
MLRGRKIIKEVNFKVEILLNSREQQPILIIYYYFKIFIKHNVKLEKSNFKKKNVRKISYEKFI